jgi:arginine/lysine/ornithine decarboxylase
MALSKRGVISLLHPPSRGWERLFETSEPPAAVYLTSPDYLGSTVPQLREIAEVCHLNGALLLVDNAHGAYLKFLPRSRHPMDLGADMCSDSAHKTLPVLTGGAYLHISRDAPELLALNAKHALAMFGSTSPSYLIMQSLDLANAYLEAYPRRLRDFAEKTEALKTRLTEAGYSLIGDEPLKITVQAKKYGYTGRELSDDLLRRGIVSEFSDPDFLVMMLPPENGSESVDAIGQALLSIPKRAEIDDNPPVFSPMEKKMSIREACLSPWETVSVGDSVGRVLAGTDVACPPAVPIVVPGELIDNAAAERLKYYGAETCRVCK